MINEEQILLARIEEVEVKITLLEQGNEEMNHVIIDQQKQIDRLTLQLEQAKAQMDKMGEMISSDDSPPPHY